VGQLGITKASFKNAVELQASYGHIHQQEIYLGFFY